MRWLRGIPCWGLCPQTPRIYRFEGPEWMFLLSVSGDRRCLSPAVPAAEPVARVASQHCPIPSDSGLPRMDLINLAVPYFSIGRRLPLNFVSHSRGSHHHVSPRPSPPPAVQSFLSLLSQRLIHPAGNLPSFLASESYISTAF